MADFTFSVTGRSFLGFLMHSGAFQNFFTEAEADFSIVSDLSEAEVLQSGTYSGRKVCYEISFEGIDCSFGTAEEFIYFDMKSPDKASTLVLLWTPGDVTVKATDGDCSPSMSRFGLWMAVNMLCIPRKCAAIHSSVNVCNGAAVMFLGESGTGKSTHTRLLRERYPEMHLLNDDSPFVRVMDDGRTLVYGSPWSGKTPCYRPLSFPVGGMVRLRQAAENAFSRLDGADAFVALYPGCSVITLDAGLCNHLYDTLSRLAGLVPVGRLDCLPDRGAALLCRRELERLREVYGNS